MCGIVGCVGQKKLISFLLGGLEKLEYRGYDSAGIAVHEGTDVKIYRASGKLKNLKDLVNGAIDDDSLKIGIGHIRWATHGIPNETNAHPHTGFKKKVSIVHNGIIENYKDLKKELAGKGYEFRSETDTEVIAHLIEDCIEQENSFDSAFRCALKRLEGAYALGVIFRDNSEILYAARKSAPLLIGIGEGANFIASDVPALLDYTKNVIYLEDNEVAEITKSSYKITNLEGGIIDKKPETLPWEPVTISKMGYKHFMLKEIHEQPDVIRQTLFDKLKSSSEPLTLKEVELTRETLEKLDRIQIIACGTSLHAALVGKYLIEEFTGIPTDVESSSEYIYKRTIVSENSITIGVSQSGETADTITAIKQAKDKGSHVLVITNRPDSTMAREADSLLPINAGFEVSVAATKSYSAQLMAFYLLAIYLAEVKNSLSQEYIEDLKKELIQIPQKIEMILSNKDKIHDCAVKFHNTRNFIYIARGINFPVALEGALKLKEISYINATGYPAGELKHGPIAMLDEEIPVLSVLVPGKVYEKVLSNSEESKARNARMIAVTSEDNEHLESVFDSIIKIPYTDEVFSPILTTIPLQLLAYYIAEFLGKDIDQPRNLAKSVTVE